MDNQQAFVGQIARPKFFKFRTEKLLILKFGDLQTVIKYEEFYCEKLQPLNPQNFQKWLMHHKIEALYLFGTATNIPSKFCHP